jgi:hypothetical protein
MADDGSGVVHGQHTLPPFSALSCWVVHAQATCTKGTSTLDIWYHSQYGFMRLTYEILHHHFLETVYKVRPAA